MKSFRILVVDDEARVHNFLKAKLRASGYEVLLASDGLEALDLIQGQEPDLIVLDLMLPKKDGFQVLQELRTFSSIPVIILSARQDDSDKIKGLELGADDYLPKPFNPDELIARIEAVRRRTAPSPKEKALEKVAFGDLTIDFKRHLLLAGEEERHLTRIEWLLLAELVHNRGRLMLYDDLLTHVWGPEYRDDLQILRTWMSRLRSKLKKDDDSPELIRTVPKTGYIMEIPSD